MPLTPRPLRSQQNNATDSTCAALHCTGRSDPEFLYEILGEVIKAGATTLNIPDTTGWNLPHEFGGLIAAIKANTPGIDNAIISTHCQNDLGLSTANSLAGAQAGARQVGPRCRPCIT